MNITQEQRRLSQQFLAYSFFSKLFFVGAVWLYFYRIFLTDYQVGILDAIAFSIGLLAEIPSGALADRFGRDTLVKLGQTTMAVGLALQALGGVTMIFVGQTLLMVGVSFTSGADSALFFSRLGFTQESAQWRKLLTKASQVKMVAILFATVAGSLVYQYSVYIPWFMSATGMFVSALVIWGVRDTRVKRERDIFQKEMKEYGSQIVTSIRLFLSPRLFLYVPLIVTLQGLYYANGWGLLRLVLLDRFHFSPFLGGIVIAASSIGTIGFLFLLHRWTEHIQERVLIAGTVVVTVVALLVSIGNIGWWGAAVIFVLYAAAHGIEPSIDEAINHRVPEENRATALSAASFLETLPYVFLAPLIGFLNTRGALEYFLVSWSLIILGALWFYLRKKEKNGHK